MHGSMNIKNTVHILNIFLPIRETFSTEMSIRVYRVTVGSVTIFGVKDILRLAAYTNILEHLPAFTERLELLMSV